jgi:hypothetical protein
MPKRRPPPKLAYERWVEAEAHKQERRAWKERDDLIVLIVSKLRTLTLDQLNGVNELADHILLLKRINKP